MDSRRFKESYTTLIQPNNLVTIQIHSGEKQDDIENVMFGIVNRVSKTTNVSGEQVAHFVEVQGGDCAQWLYWNKNWLWAYAGTRKEANDGIRELQKRIDIWKWLFPNENKADLPSAKILQGILTDYIGLIMPNIVGIFKWKAIPTNSIEAKFRDEEPILGLGERYVPDQDLAAYSGSMANLLQDYALDYLSELWSDTTPQGDFGIYYRRPPFDSSDWLQFRERSRTIDSTRILHILSDAEILRVDLGRSLDEYFNFISVLPWIYAANTSIMRLVMNPRLDAESIAEKGLRPLLPTLRYLDHFAEENQVSLIRPSGNYHTMIEAGAFTNELVRAKIPTTQIEASVRQAVERRGRLSRVAEEWNDILWRWHSRLDAYYTGRITVKGKPEIRVGHKVELPSETRKHFAQPMGFFVSSVRHDYEVEAGHFLTSVGLVRGQAKDGFIRPVTDGKEDILEADRAKLSSRIVDRRSLHLEIFLEREGRR